MRSFKLQVSLLFVSKVQIERLLDVERSFYIDFRAKKSTNLLYIIHWDLCDFK